MHDTQDEGFTLVETVAALGIVLVTMLGLLSTGLYAARSVVVSRQAQQAADVLNAEIESLRSQEYASLTMVSTDPGLATDPLITTVAGVRHMDPGTGVPEPLDTRAVGAVGTHAQTVTTPNGAFTVRRYVTIPAGTPVDVAGMPAVRRVTVAAEWTTRGVLRTRRSSTLLAHTRRGLPLPFYSLQYSGPAPLAGTTPTWTVNPGNSVSFGLLVRNQGARDSFTLSASTAGWTFYRDTDGDGLWSGDPLVEPTLTASRTDQLEPSAAPFAVVAHAVAGSSAGTTTTTFSATSVAQPSHPAKTVLGTVVITTGSVSPPPPPPPPPPPAGTPCTPGAVTAVSDSGAATGASTPSAYTLSQIRLLNGPTVGDTAAQSTLVMGKALEGVQADPCNWSTDLHASAAGRAVGTTGTVPAGRVRWVFDPASAAEREWAGTAKVVLHVRCPAGATPVLTAQVGTLSGGTPSVAATGTGTPSGCDAAHFQRVDLTLAIGGSIKATGQTTFFLDVTSDTPVTLLYGTTAAASRLVVGMK